MATLPLAETAPEFRRYERIGEIAYSKQQGEIAKAKIRAHPDLFAKNALRRVFFFWVSVPTHTTATSWAASLPKPFAASTSPSSASPASSAWRWPYAATFPARGSSSGPSPSILPLLLRHGAGALPPPLEPIICVLSVYLFQSADRTRAWSWFAAGREYEAKLAVLRAAIDEGDASGIAEGDVFARVRRAATFPRRSAEPSGTRLICVLGKQLGGTPCSDNAVRPELAMRTISRKAIQRLPLPA